MNTDYILLIAGILLTILGAVIGFVEKLFSDVANKKIGKYFAFIASILVVLGAVISFLSGKKSLDDKIISEAKEEKEKRMKDSLQNELLKLSRIQLDTALSILSLNRQLNNAQFELNRTQKLIIDIQNNSFEQLSGGNNKPYLSFGYGIHIGIDKNVYFPMMYIRNLGNTYLKNVEVWIENPLRVANFKNDENVREFDFYLFSKKNNDTNYVYKNLHTLSPKSNIPVYESKFPYHNLLINFSAHVLWSNGAYSVNTSQRYYKDTLFVKNVDFVMNGKIVEDQYAFTGLKTNNITREYKKCKSIIYKGIIYDVYWHEKNHSVLIKRPKKIHSVTPYGIRGNTRDSAPNVAMLKLVEVFGE